MSLVTHRCNKRSDKNKKIVKKRKNGKKYIKNRFTTKGQKIHRMTDCKHLVNKDVGRKR